MRKNYNNYETENQYKVYDDENIVKSATRKAGKTAVDTTATVLGVTAGLVAAGAIVKLAGKAVSGVKSAITNKLATKKAAEVDEIAEDDFLCENESNAEEETDNE